MAKGNKGKLEISVSVKNDIDHNDHYVNQSFNTKITLVTQYTGKKCEIMGDLRSLISLKKVFTYA